MKHYAYTITLQPHGYDVHIGECPDRETAEQAAARKMEELGAPAWLIIGVSGPTSGVIDAHDLETARDKLKARISF